jgi:hypothetical protein
MERILNLTQHPASPEQIAVGVIEPRDKQVVRNLLTFDAVPTRDQIKTRAEALAQVARDHGVNYAMIGGVGYLMGPLEQALMDFPQVQPIHAFTRRETVEELQGDGSTKKTAVFRHVGFVESATE